MLEERPALDELHREEPAVLGRHELVQDDQVGVHEIGESPELALEAIEGFPARLPQHLEGDPRFALPVVGGIHDAETSGAEARLHREAIGAREGFGVGHHGSFGFYRLGRVFGPLQIVRATRGPIDRRSTREFTVNLLAGPKGSL
jgi:hypothetical protein